MESIRANTGSQLWKMLLISVLRSQELQPSFITTAIDNDQRLRDKFVAETIYDMVRWKRLYNEIAGTKDHYNRENIWKNFQKFFLKNHNHQSK